MLSEIVLSLSAGGSMFQATGPADENDLGPIVTVRVNGTARL